MSGISVDPLTTNVGAVVGGVHLSRLSDDGVDAVRAALLKHKVIFVRDQHLEPAEQERFAKQLGTLTLAHPTVPTKEVFTRDSKEGYRSDAWHTDVTYLAAPPAITILQAMEVPEYGGDTLWSSTAAAYAALPDVLKNLAESLRVIHELAPNRETQQRMSNTEVGKKLIAHGLSKENDFVAEHSLVTVHPETGERALQVGQFARHIVGLSTWESEVLLNIFQSYVTKPEHFVRWRWVAGDVAIWDNRATQHYATYDYGDKRRVMNRITLAGEPTVGVDSRVGTNLSDASKELVFQR